MKTGGQMRPHMNVHNDRDAALLRCRLQIVPACNIDCAVACLAQHIVEHQPVNAAQIASVGFQYLAQQFTRRLQRQFKAFDRGIAKQIIFHTGRINRLARRDQRLFQRCRGA